MQAACNGYVLVASAAAASAERLTVERLTAHQHSSARLSVRIAAD